MRRSTRLDPCAAMATVMLCIAIATVAHATTTTGTRKGTSFKAKMVAPSVGEVARAMHLYLPPSYSRPESASRRYPVIYMLHGWPGSESNMLKMGHANVTADSLIARGAIPEVILVFANGTGTGWLGRSLWIDSFDGRKRVATYVTHDLIDWVDAHYRTDAAAEGRGIIGISEGGTAALNLAFKHPELFSACAGHSADYVLRKGLSTSWFLGGDPGGTQRLADNSPGRYAQTIVPQLKRQRIYIDCGTEDGAIAASRAFHAKLDSLGVPHEYHEFPGGHSWKYWGAHFRQSLVAVAGALK